MRLVVSRDSWHAQVYAWWYGKKYPEAVPVMEQGFSTGLFTFHHGTVPKRSNLCPYMRAVLFWAPLRFLFVQTPNRWITLAAIFGSLPWLGGHQWRIVVLALYVMTMAAVLLVLSVAGIVYLISEGHLNLKPVYAVARPLAPATQSFFQLLGEYLRSFHDRICPEVEFSEEND